MNILFDMQVLSKKMHNFRIEATFLEHGVDNIGWRITEKDSRKFEEKLEAFGIRGPMVSKLEEEGFLIINEKRVSLEEVSHIRKGDTISVVIDTLACQQAIDIAKKARASFM